MHPKVEEAAATVATGTATGLGKVGDGHVPDLVPRYYERLRLDPASLDPEPTLEKLCRLQEAHLAQIPFENIAQHRNDPAADDSAVLDLKATAKKVLDDKRGGFCFEINGLFAQFLVELGYSVTLVPSQVYIPEIQAFTDVDLHLFLVVHFSSTSEYYVADVAFGEPSLHPLLYHAVGKVFQEEQVTPEGMHNRFQVRSNEIVYQWNINGEWVDRFKWKHEEGMKHSIEGRSLTAFADRLALVLADGFIFSEKLIVCRLTREKKITLAGNRLKITGPPRFVHESGDPDQEKSNVTIRFLQDTEEARKVLHEEFGIPLAATTGLLLTKSLNADPALWAQM
jgi:N-hydroxyarylamine O-acetyltransferase